MIFLNRIAKSKCVFILIVFLLNGIYSFAQKEIVFRVVDEKNQSPVQFCYVLVKGKTTSSQSDGAGFVKIKAKSEDTLVVYQLGYFTQKAAVSDILHANNLVLLKSKNLTLEEVVVKSNRTDTFQAGNNILFLDFEFYDDLILALVNKGRKYNSLWLLDLEGNKITEKNLSIKSETLFKDCFENIHLLTADSTYQVFYNYKNITLLKPYYISNYYNLLQPCECYHGDKYVFKSKQYRNLKNIYYLYDESSKGYKKTIAVAADSSAIKGFNMDYDLNYFLTERKKGFSYQTSVEEIKKHIDQLREDLNLNAEYTNLLRPVESEMKKVDTCFFLFDYTNQSVASFSFDGSFYNKVSLPDFSGISPKLIIDYDTQSMVFSGLNKKGLLTLYKYNRITNSFTHIFELKGYFYIRKFKVKGNHLYFINNDRSSDLVKKKIIKESISWKKIT